MSRVRNPKWYKKKKRVVYQGYGPVVFKQKGQTLSKDLEEMKIKLNKKKTTIIMHKFYNIGDTSDPWFYFFYDVVSWDQKKLWNLYKPHYLSFFLRKNERKKWGYVRFLNKVFIMMQPRKKKPTRFVLHNEAPLPVEWEVPIKKEKKNLKNMVVYESWKLKKKSAWEKRVTPYHSWRDQQIQFKYKRYYLFYVAQKFNYYFWKTLMFKKLIVKKGVFVKGSCEKYKRSLYFFFNTFFNFNSLLKQYTYTRLFLLKNNKIYYRVDFFYNYWLIPRDPFYIAMEFHSGAKKKIYKVIIWWRIWRGRVWRLRRIYMYIIEEKQKLFKNFSILYKDFFKMAREWNLFEKYIKKRRRRRKKNEPKIVKIKIRKPRRKRRTKNQLFAAFMEKVKLAHRLIWIIDKYKSNLIRNLKQNNNTIWQIKNLFVFFEKTFIVYSKEKIINLDSVFAYLLPYRTSQIRYGLLSFADDPFFNLWRGYYKKKKIVDMKIIQTTKLKNIGGNIKIFNKVKIIDIYKYLALGEAEAEDYKDNNNKKNIYLMKHIVTYLRFLKKHTKLFININYIFNVYFWLVIVLKGLNFSSLANIKMIYDYTNFFNLISKLIKMKYNWFNIEDFPVFVNILTKKNEIIKLQSTFTYLVQEACLYLYSMFLKVKPKSYATSFFQKVKDMTTGQCTKLNYVFKGDLSVEINPVVFFTNIKNKNQEIAKDFLIVLQNFLNKCDESISFIKNHLKFYLILLENIYELFDEYMLTTLEKFNCKRDYIYIRYRNSILLGTNKSESSLLKLWTEFFFMFLYYFLKLYFFFIIIVNLEIQPIEFLNYSIIKKKKQIIIKPSFFALIQLLFYYNVLTKNNNKIIIKPAMYLLKLTCIQIFNYFLNIWQEVYYYYYMIKTNKLNRKKQKLNKHLKEFNEILYKACFLTVYVKFQNQNKNMTYKYFKKVFQFPKISEEALNIISKNNYKKVDMYIINKTKFNLKYLVKKEKKEKKKIFK